MLKLKNNMKVIAIMLLALVWVLLANVIAVFVFPEYKIFIQSRIGTRQMVTADAIQTPAAIKLSDTLDRLSYGIEALSGTGGVSTQVGGVVKPASPATNTWILATLPVTITPPPAPPIIPPKPVVPPKPAPTIYPLSVLLQAKMIPDITTKVVENKWIFDIRIFTSLDYTTYRDDKNRINIYAFSETYPVMLTNLKLVSNVYSIKETDTFFEASFFLNPTNKRDTTIRFVTSITGKAYGFEIPKVFYPRIKKLLTNT